MDEGRRPHTANLNGCVVADDVAGGGGGEGGADVQGSSGRPIRAKRRKRVSTAAVAVGGVLSWVPRHRLDAATTRPIADETVGPCHVYEPVGRVAEWFGAHAWKAPQYHHGDIVVAFPLSMVRSSAWLRPLIRQVPVKTRAVPMLVALLVMSACARRGAGNGAPIDAVSQLQGLLDSGVSHGIPGHSPPSQPATE